MEASNINDGADDGNNDELSFLSFFQMNLGNPVFIEAKDDGSGSDNWSYKSCKAPVRSSPTNQHLSALEALRNALYKFKTYFTLLLTGRMPFLSPNQQCQSTEGKISHSMDLFTQADLGVFQLCL